MDAWFQVTQIDDNTYAISEYKHWEEPHCYLLIGKEQAVLIDTGLGIANIKEVIDTLTALPVQVVTTHAHWDHIGGHALFQNFALHESELEWISGRFSLPLDTVKYNLTCLPCCFPDRFNPECYAIFQGVPSQLLRDGDVLNLGGRTLEVIHTPGHSPGHCCFYEPERKYLYSGDLIYCGTLDAFYPTTNPKQFYHSVTKISSLDVSRILPGHHSLDVSSDIIRRIETAFQELDAAGKLYHGNGLFDYGTFQIHI